MPRSTVWWVSSLRSITSAGSSAWRRWRAEASLSSSAWVRGFTAMPSTAAGGSMGSTLTGVPLGASVSPVRVAASLATAARSPATTSATGVCSLPRSRNRPWSRSVAPEAGFTRWSSALIVPDSTLNSESWPT